MIGECVEGGGARGGCSGGRGGGGVGRRDSSRGAWSLESGLSSAVRKERRARSRAVRRRDYRAELFLVSAREFFAMSCLDVMYQVFGPQPYFSSYSPYHHQVRLGPARTAFFFFFFFFLRCRFNTTRFLPENFN